MDTLARLIADQRERDRVQDAALRRAETAEAKLRERSTYLAVLEHKLKFPLALLRGWSDILAERWQELPVEVRTDALHIVADLTRAMGGTVTAQRRDGRGSTLLVTLPLAS